MQRKGEGEEGREIRGRGHEEGDKREGGDAKGWEGRGRVGRVEYECTVTHDNLHIQNMADRHTPTCIQKSTCAHTHTHSSHAQTVSRQSTVIVYYIPTTVQGHVLPVSIALCMVTKQL